MLNSDCNDSPALQDILHAFCEWLRSPKAGKANKKLNYSFPNFCKMLTYKVKCKPIAKNIGARLYMKLLISGNLLES